MMEEPPTAKRQEMALREVEPAAAVVTETQTGEDSQAPQGKTASDVSSEACETAAQPIEQASKRISSYVPGVGSQPKVFISHCKRTPGTEDRAIWIADVLDSTEAEVKA